MRADVRDLTRNSVNRVDSKIRKVVLHKDWGKTGENAIYFDIALVFIQDQVTFSKTLQPICLPNETFPSLPNRMEGQSLTTAGWGRDRDDTYGEELTIIDVTLRSNLECNGKYKGIVSKGRL